MQNPHFCPKRRGRNGAPGRLSPGHTLKNMNHKGHEGTRRSADIISPRVVFAALRFFDLLPIGNTWETFLLDKL